MIEPIDYLQYASRHFGRRRYDFASSGVPSLEPDRLELTASSLIDPRSVERFTAAIAARYGVPEDEVVPCLGTSQALWAACAALVAPGSTVAVEKPGYEPLWRVPQGLGAQVARIRRKASEGWAIDPDRALSAAGEGGVAIVSDLYNPGGTVADPAALRALAEGITKRGGWLIVDEVYRDLRLHLDGPTTARRLGGNVVTISSLTKVYGLGWARAGWVMAPPDVARRVRDAIVHASGWNPPLSAAAGAATLARADELFDDERLLRGEKLERAAYFVEKHPRLSWVEPEPGGLFGFVATQPEADVGALIEGPLATRDVLVSDGAFFGAPGWFRLGVANIDGALVDDGLTRLGETL
jgi:aspartate/methionine/tyrosine aminotransferase